MSEAPGGSEASDLTRRIGRVARRELGAAGGRLTVLAIYEAGS